MLLTQSGAGRAESHLQVLTSRRSFVDRLKGNIPKVPPPPAPVDVAVLHLQLLFLLRLQCITDDLRARGINVSTSLPDDVLYFVRRHPLMSKQIQPIDKRPLLFRRSTDYTHMAVQAIQGMDGETYHVMYMGTGAYQFILQTLKCPL